MAYEIKVVAILKTFGKKTHQELEKIVDEALWKHPDLRDVLMTKFESDAEDKKTKLPFTDINLQTIRDEYKKMDVNEDR